MSNVLDRDAIFASNDLKTELVNVPEWGGDIYVRVMTGYQRDQWEINTKDVKSGVEGVMALLAIFTVCDEEGDLLFGYEDLDKLNERSCSALSKIFEVALKLNALRQSEIEELAGN